MKLLIAAVAVVSVGILSASVQTASAQEWGDSYYRSYNDYRHHDYGRLHDREREYRNYHRDDRRSHHRNERRHNSKKNNAWIQKFK